MNACVFEHFCDVREERKGVCSLGERFSQTLFCCLFVHVRCDQRMSLRPKDVDNPIIYVLVHIFSYIPYIYIHIDIYVYTHVFICIYTHILVYTHIYIYT